MRHQRPCHRPCTLHLTLVLLPACISASLQACNVPIRVSSGTTHFTRKLCTPVIQSLKLLEVIRSLHRPSAEPLTVFHLITSHRMGRNPEWVQTTEMCLKVSKSLALQFLWADVGSGAVGRIVRKPRACCIDPKLS